MCVCVLLAQSCFQVSLGAKHVYYVQLLSNSQYFHKTKGCFSVLYLQFLNRVLISHTKSHQISSPHKNNLKNGLLLYCNTHLPKGD